MSDGSVAPETALPFPVFPEASPPPWAHWVRLGLLAVVWGWALLVLAGPLLIPADTAPDLTGVVGRYDNREVIGEMNPLARFVYWMGDVNCHQIHERSFTCHGNQLPFCARCTAIFVGLALGLSLNLHLRWDPSLRLLLMALVPIGLDGGIQLVTGYESTNLRRAVTGLIAGGFTGLALEFILREMLAPRPPLPPAWREVLPGGGATPDDDIARDDDTGR